MPFNYFYKHLDDSDDLHKRLLSLWFMTAVIPEISPSHIGIPWLQNMDSVPGDKGTKAHVADEHSSFPWTKRMLQNCPLLLA